VEVMAMGDAEEETVATEADIVDVERNIIRVIVQ